jgi:hypothetical protein
LILADCLGSFAFPPLPIGAPPVDLATEAHPVLSEEFDQGATNPLDGTILFPT